jgi:predicted Zn finger-like uncharacterized protein
MIVTCASCLTKFNLDDSRVSPKGAKVRCSRCKHVFYVYPPAETREEEAVEGFESFVKSHEDLLQPSQLELEGPPAQKGKRREIEPEEEQETIVFTEKAPGSRPEPRIREERERAEAKPVRSRSTVRRERRRISPIFGLLLVLFLLIFGVFYVWTELGSGGRLSKVSSYLEYPIKKISELKEQIWGTEKEGLIIRDLNTSEVQIRDMSLYIIDGKVVNQSPFTKKRIKVSVVIFDQNQAKIAEKETVCGRSISREELENLPPEFFAGEMLIQPQTEGEAITPSGKSTPFTVIFKDLSTSEARGFKVDVVEAPKL